jgi:hypothetical protein
MDEKWLDEVVKVCAAGESRRDMLRVLLVSAAGGVLAMVRRPLGVLAGSAGRCKEIGANYRPCGRSACYDPSATPTQMCCHCGDRGYHIATTNSSCDDVCGP